MKQRHIHFVGHTDRYRSRMAALYLRRLVPKEWVITSSGATTTMSQAAFDAADIVVFLDKASYEHALKLLALDARKVAVWDILPLQTYVKRYHLDVAKKADLQRAVEVILKRVKSHCDELYRYISQGSWVDVVTSKNELTGIKLPIAWVNDRGLWFRSAHVVLLTPKGEVLLEKRSPIITFAPGKLDITLGGAVDAGETPLQAAVRETHEELGIRLAPSQLRRVAVTKENSWHPSLQTHSRTIRYVYTAQLRPDQMLINTDPLEVGGIAILSRHELKTLLRTHRARHFGALPTTYRFYSDVVAQSLKVLKTTKKPKKPRKK